MRLTNRLAPLRRRLVPYSLCALGLGVLLVTLSILILQRSAAGRIHSAATAPTAPVAVVFGAMVYPGGVASPVLRERVEAAVHLYQAGKVRKLLMTGDNGRADYDEPTAMKDLAVRMGVPEGDVTCDFAGFRTHDSLVRARRVFHVEQALLVTQRWHLPRALYLARAAGIEAVGVASEEGMPPAMVRKQELRELLAAPYALLDGLFHRQPRFLGPSEPLFAGDTSHS